MRKLILVQGCPGSGKSHLAKQIIDEYYREAVETDNIPSMDEAIILSTDNFWITPEGNYEFKAELLGMAHGWCQKLCAKAMFDGLPLIVIDNTNIKKKDVEYYLDNAKRFGYTVEVVRPANAWSLDAEECFKRCTHGVPLETIQRMLNSMEDLLG